MKTITYIFATVAFVLVSFSSQATNFSGNTKGIPPTNIKKATHIATFTSNFLTDMIEQDAVQEADTHLFGLEFRKDFLTNIIEQDAIQEANAYILDLKTFKLESNYLREMIEDNAETKK